jgi:hypothetical protein
LFTGMAVSLVVSSGVALAVDKNGTNGRDTLRGTNRADTLVGKGGSDVLSGLAGRDQMLGGPAKIGSLAATSISSEVATRNWWEDPATREFMPVKVPTTLWAEEVIIC